MLRPFLCNTIKILTLSYQPLHFNYDDIVPIHL